MAPPTEAFISKISKKVNGVLPRPRATGNKIKVVSPSFIPRRSRRVAGMGVEPQPRLPAQRHAKMTVLKTIANFRIDDKAVLFPRIMDDYAKLFGNLLFDSQTSALAALFGWAIPAPQEEQPALEA
jgi:hypothetical protein